MGDIYETIPCDDFDSFVNKVKELTKKKDNSHSWVFKGLEKANWTLKTTLERECERFGLLGDEVHQREYNMIREFQRRLHHYEANVPLLRDVDEWMALMQHYGAPTRLLDFTYSPWVAAFFAFEKATYGEVAIWAINGAWISNKFKSKFKSEEFQYLSDAEKKYGNYRDPDAFRTLFLDEVENKYVLAVNPFRLNDRLAYQQGLFLCPASVSAGFMENLGGLVTVQDDDAPVKKFVISTGEKGKDRDEALKDLHLMNINRITLFPGLAGFAESFKVGIMTVYGEHWVASKGDKMAAKDLWKNAFEYWSRSW